MREAEFWYASEVASQEKIIEDSAALQFFSAADVDKFRLRRYDNYCSRKLSPPQDTSLNLHGGWGG